MFKSITYLRYEYDKILEKHIYYYHLVDSEFECEVLAAAAAIAPAPGTTGAALAAVEYHKRNFPIIKNIYLLNNFLLNEWYSTWSFKELLEYQNQYIDKYYPIPGINFSKDICPKLLEMHKELSIYG